jgi:sn-glycerol 3-phosphate transport system substrate-binding protein
VAEVMKDAGVKFDPKAYIPAVAGYYTAPNGQMLSFPFNSSTTVFYYNKDAFKKAGLDPTSRPRPGPKWSAAAKLKASGHSCPFTTSWMSWTQLELLHLAQHAVRHQNNGFGGTGRAPEDQLARCTCATSRTWPTWPSRACSSTRAAQQGRRPSPGECAMIGLSSGYASIQNAKFEFGVPLPYYPDVQGAPQNTVIGGASLWVMAGKKAESTRAWPSSSTSCPTPKCRPPATSAPATCRHHGGLRADREVGFYKKNPGTDVAVNQMIRKTTDKSRGIRLGNFVQIRTILDEEPNRSGPARRPPRRRWTRRAARQRAAGALPGRQVSDRFDHRIEPPLPGCVMLPALQPSPSGLV